jgi:hypothetical protein
MYDERIPSFLPRHDDVALRPLQLVGWWLRRCVGWRVKVCGGHGDGDGDGDGDERALDQAST